MSFALIADERHVHPVAGTTTVHVRRDGAGRAHRFVRTVSPAITFVMGYAPDGAITHQFLGVTPGAACEKCDAHATHIVTRPAHLSVRCADH